MPKMKYWPLRYGVAVAAVAAGIAFLLIPQIGKGLGSILFLAVLISAWYGGVGPGLLATALITVVAIRGVARFEPSFAPWRVASIVLFVGGGVLITLLVEALHAARRRVEAAHQELVRRMEQLAEADVRKDEFLAMLATSCATRWRRSATLRNWRPCAVHKIRSAGAWRSSTARSSTWRG